MNFFYIDVENGSLFVIVRKARLSLQLVNATVQFLRVFCNCSDKKTQLAKEG